MDNPLIFLIALCVCILLFSCSRDEPLDTSWHLHQGSINENDPAHNIIRPGEDGWRIIGPSQPGETLPSGKTSSRDDMTWEWYMEITNISEEKWDVKTKFFLVTTDNLPLAQSEDPVGKDNWHLLAPGEKKVFTGKGFVDKKDISRISRGRGLIGKKLAADE